MWAAVHRNDAGLMTRLHEQHHIPWRLNNLVIPQVACAITSAESRYAPRDATERVVEVFWTVATPRSRGRSLPPSPRLCGERRNVSIGRIHHERRVVIELSLDHLLRAMGRPRTLEPSRVRQGRQKHRVASSEIAVAALEDPIGARFQLGHFLVSQEWFPFERLWSLERGGALAEPDALEIGRSAGSAGGRPELLVGSLRARSGRPRHGRDCCGDDRA